MLPNIRVVLVNTSHPGNIGGAARAMKNMGLSRLVLVEPRVFPHHEADARASGAGDSFVGGMVYGLASGLTPEDAFRLGVASGTASVMMPGTQLCRKEDVDRILEEIGAHHNNW